MVDTQRKVPGCIATWTYNGYLHERASRQGFFNNGASDVTPEAKQQRADRSKRPRERLTSEAANMKEVANHDSMQGCWNLDSPFAQPWSVGVQISGTPGKQKAAAKRPPTRGGSPRPKPALKRVRGDQVSDEQTRVRAARVPRNRVAGSDTKKVCMSNECMGPRACEV
jgi:hypothetical protein